jgi:dihydrofolate synthase/folylpolyglutamate synthase
MDMDYPATLTYLDDVQGRGIKLGLRTMTALLRSLGHPESAFPSVAVAGTNGKGSVSAFLAAILRAAGVRDGLYTSPHLVRYEERIAVDGRPLGAAAFAAAVTEVRDRIAILEGAGELAAHPTHFEILTAAALHHFRQERVGAAVLEVGLGGRLDAVAAAGARAAVITRISLDHTQHLGGTVEAIAAEKAGVAGPECRVVVTGEEHPGALERIRASAAARGVTLVEAAGSARPGPPRRAGAALSLATSREDYGDLTLSLEGRHQIDNAVLAVLAAERLHEAGIVQAPLGRQSIIDGLARTRWPGRLQVVGREPLVVLDGAHNPDGCVALARWLRESLTASQAGRLCLVFGALQDKDIGSMTKELFPLAGHLVVTRGRSDRFADPWGLAARARELSRGEVEVISGLGDALGAARAWAGPAGAVCLCGSLYLVGDAMEVLGLEPYAGNC